MNGYLVVVEGDYFGSASEFDRKREKYPYRVTVKVPRPEGALSLIKNKLLDKVLRRNYANYHIWRTHQLVSITNLDGSKVPGLTDPRLMDFNDLAEYVRANDLPLKLELYTDLGYLRTMVYLAETNQHEFRIKQENLEREHKEDVELALLNPEVFSSEGSQLLQGSDIRDNIAAKAMTPYPRKEAPSKRSKKTTIIERKEEIPQIAEVKAGEVFLNKTVDAPSSVLLTEDKPKVQKVEKVFVKGKGFVSADAFKEDFTREDEKEFEVYDPHNITSEISVEDL